MLSWIFLILSAFLFSSGFLCNKLFQKNNGSGLKSSLEYLFIGSVVICISMPIIGGASFEFSWFSLFIAVVYSINSFALTYFGIKAFKYANLSVYSMFMMLGSIVIPSAVGIAFYNEAITLARTICFAFIFIALYLSVSKGQSSKKAIIYYALVFALNGMAGVLSKIHQSFPEINVSTNDFLLMTGLIKLFMSGTVLLFLYIKAKEKHPSLRACFFALGGGLLNAVGNYLNLFALIAIPITVHSVVTTGLVLIGSAVIGLFIKEKPSKKAIASLLFALIAVVFSVV